MRVILTLPWGRRLGGAEAMVQMALEGALAAGHELEPVFLQPGPWPQELAAAGLRVEVIDAGRLREARRYAKTVGRLAGILRARDPDLVLNWSPKTQLYGAPAAALAGMADRVVWWQHDVPQRTWIDQAATLLPARAVGCSSRAGARAQERLFPRRRTVVVEPGSPEPAQPAAPAPLTLPNGVPVVGMVGRLQPWKGQDRLLRAQAILRERGLPIHTLIVGGDSYGLSPQYAARLPRLARELGLEGEVTFAGEVPDAGPYVERMDVLVNASDPEPFGIVLLEGMARGVAVAAVDSGGPAEFIEDGRTGVLARSGEPLALADALQRLLATPGLRERVAAAGRELYLRRFTAEAMRERFFAALEGERVRDGSAPGEAGDVTIVANDVGSVGGMERQLAELALGLSRRGHRVRVIAWTCELPEGAAVEFHRVRGPRRPFAIAYPWFLLAGSLAVRRHRRGIVQSTGAIVLNRLDVVAVHCCHQVYRQMPNTPMPLHGAYLRAIGALKRAVERLCFAVNREATFVCVSEGVAGEVREHYPKAAARTIAIHNGVDADAFAPGVRLEQARKLRDELGIAPDRLLAAFVGGDWEHKGLRLAIEALAQAPGWELLVAGRGARQHFRQLADSLGVGGAVHWLGVVRDVQVVYEAADAFVLPSSYETFSLVTFEAAASGLPVIATPVSGVRELIEDGRSGFLVSRDAHTIAERLRRLGGDPELRRRLGESARESARSFTWERMVEEHHRLYERLAAARR